MSVREFRGTDEMPAAAAQAGEEPERLLHVPKTAFAVALILAPLVVALVALPFRTASAFALAALVAGGPSYLLVGGPVFWWGLRRDLDAPFVLAWLGMIANLVALPLALIVWGVLGEGRDLAAIAALYFTFGTLFSALWGAAFGLLYRGLRRISS